MEDLEDDIDEVPSAQPAEVDLFGEDDDEDYNYGERRVAEAEREPAAAAPATEAPATAEDRRAALLKLAQKKRKETEGGEARTKKKQKKDRDGSSAKNAEKGSKEPRRSRRGEAEPSTDKHASAGGDQPEMLSDVDELADDDFIDDEGVPLDEIVPADDDDEGTAALLMPPEEAIEVAPGEEDEADDDADPFGKKKRRKRKESDQQMALVVDDKIAKMEAAAEADMEEHEQSRPAVQKLKILAETEDFLAQKKYHELFISAGGLGVLKAWLEPYADGSLPNTRIRSAVLRACKLLPIDTSREEMKSQLKKSKLGNRIMFLHRCQDETTANRQLARELVSQWSRPIFHDANVESEKRRIREQQLKVARAAAIEAQKEIHTQQVATQKPKIKYGETGYRWHASIPQASKLDYVVQPKQDERLTMNQAVAAAAHVPANTTRFAKKMREVQRKQKSTTARAAKPSVEGRTITLMHH